MIDHERADKLLAELWDLAGDATIANRPDREAAFRYAAGLVHEAVRATSCSQKSNFTRDPNRMTPAQAEEVSRTA